MTEKLYYKDSHIRIFDALVTGCEKYRDGWAVTLDKTAFFPEGGGQPGDTGVLGGVRVTDTRESGGEVIHYTDAPLEIGTKVTGELNFEQRLRRMQNHSGEHIVSGLVYRLYGFNNTGFHMGADCVTVDFDGELDREALNNIERLANIAVAENVPVKASFPSPGSLKRLKYRSKLELSENVRIVKIKGYDTCACCAPHVLRTGEIGIIKILDFMRHRGGVRISLLCGLDALEDYQKRYESTAEISVLLSKKQHEVAPAVKRVLEELGSLKLSLSEAKKQLAAAKAAAVSQTEGNLLFIETDLDTNTLRELVSLGMNKCTGLCAGFTGTEGDYKYIIGSRQLDMRSIAKDINSALNGRGGGKADMIQGSAACTKKEIEDYFHGKAVF